MEQKPSSKIAKDSRADFTRREVKEAGFLSEVTFLSGLSAQGMAERRPAHWWPTEPLNSGVCVSLRGSVSRQVILEAS